jgi:hypothetical protein
LVWRTGGWLWIFDERPLLQARASSNSNGRDTARRPTNVDGISSCGGLITWFASGSSSTDDRLSKDPKHRTRCSPSKEKD